MNTDQAILRLMKQHHISEQVDLLALLESEGIHLTQSTLSRRFRKLSVVKLDGRYQQVATPRISVPSFSVETAPPNILVLRLAPGLAQAVGLQLDHSDIEGIVGTVAGDDTIIIVARPPEDLESIKSRLEDFLSK